MSCLSSQKKFVEGEGNEHMSTNIPSNFYQFYTLLFFFFLSNGIHTFTPFERIVLETILFLGDVIAQNLFLSSLII